MSTLQHTSQPAIRTRLALVVVIAGAVAVLVIALLVANSGGLESLSAPSGAPPHLSQAQIERQLEAVSGPRYGVVRPATSSPSPAPAQAQASNPQEQLQAVAGARYRQPIGRHDAR
jgi:hypothetical protein